MFCFVFKYSEIYICSFFFSPVFWTTEEDVDVDDVLAEDAVVNFYNVSHNMLSLNPPLRLYCGEVIFFKCIYLSQDFTKVESSNDVKDDKDSETIEPEP